MNYRFLFLFFFILSCTTIETKDKEVIIFDSSFSNKGFTILSDESSKSKKIISSLIDERSLIIFQRNLKKDTDVKITNLINNKSIIAKVGKNIKYPNFYNSVISKRIYNDLEIDQNEPYVLIEQINSSKMFLAKKAKTFDEEKEVADKAPVDQISIKDLSESTSKIIKKSSKSKFKYIIKIADFYFEDTAILLKERIINETKVKNIKINNIAKNNYRLYLGPFTNLSSLKNAFNDISKLNFENIEIIKK